MADGSVLLEVTVEGKNIKLVQRQVEDLANATNRAADAQGAAAKKEEAASTKREKTYRRQERALNSLSGRAKNSTSDFARQSSVINSGLVPAYAAIASNVFALSAAFGVLQRNAAIQQLEASLTSLGVTAGKNFSAIASELEKVSGFAISTQQALQTTAQGVGAGFSGQQLKDFTTIAKGASIALGRNLPDALDRLVRGTAKLEPEILDELGIFVRLDDAAEDYAGRIGKTASELTQFERRQAFANAVTEKGIQKFKDIADSVETNPYDRLSASITNISKVLLDTIGTAFTPFIEFFAQNELALTGALLIFVNTIKNQISPALQNVAEDAAEFAEKVKQEAGESANVLSSQYVKQLDIVKSSIKTVPKSFEKLVPSIEKGTASVAQLKEGVISLERSERARVAKVKGNESQLTAAKKAELEEVRKLKTEIQNLIALESQRSKSSFTFFDKKALAASSDAYANTISQIANSTGIIDKLKVSFSGVITQLGILKISAKEAATSGLNVFQKSAVLARIASTALGNSVKILGFAFLQAIPIIGQVIAAIGLLREAWQYFFPKSAETKSLEETREAYEELEKTFLQFQRTLASSSKSDSEKAVAGLTIRKNLLESFPDIIRKYQDAVRESSKNTLTEQDAQIEKLKKVRDTFKENSSQYKVYTKQIEQLEAQKSATLEKSRKLDGKGLQNLKKEFDEQIASAKNSGVKFGDELQKINALFSDGLVNPEALNGDVLIQAINDILLPIQNLEAASKGLTTSFSEYDKEVAKLSKKQQTPFSGLITQLEAVQENFNTLFTGNKELISEDQLKKARETLKIYEKVFNIQIAEGDERAAINKALKETSEKLKKAEETIIRQKVEADAYGNKLKYINEISKNSVELTEYALSLEEQKTQALIRSTKASLDLAIISAGNNKDSAEVITLTAKLAELENSLLSDKQKEIKIGQARIAGQQRELDIQTKIAAEIDKQNNLKASLARKELELSRAQTGSSITEEDELALIRTQNKLAEESEQRKFNLQMRAIELQTELVIFQLEAEKEKTRIARERNEEALATEYLKTGQIKNFDNRLKGIQDLKNAENAINKLITGQRNLTAETIETLIIQGDINSKIRKANENLAEENALRAKTRLEAEKQSETLNFITSLTAGSVAKETEKLQLLQTEQQLLKDIEGIRNEGEENSQAFAEKNLELTKNRNAQKLKELEITEQITQELINQANNITSNLKSQADAIFQIQQLRNKDPFTDRTANVFKEIQLQDQNRERQLKIAELERDIKFATIEAEEKLLEAKFELLKAEASKSEDNELYQKVVSAANRSLQLTKDANKLRRATIDLEYGLLREQFKYASIRDRIATVESAGPGQGVLAAAASLFTPKETPEDTGLEASINTFDSTLSSLQTKLGDYTNAIISAVNIANSSRLTSDPSTGGQGAAALGESLSPSSFDINGASANSSQGESITTGVETGTRAISETSGPVGLVQVFQQARILAAGFKQDLLQFGPGGEAMSALIAGIEAVGVAFQNLDVSFTSTKDKLQATSQILGGVSAAIGGLGAIAQASADMRVQAIDREIAAERQRDGQSEASQAKIKALEAKKEQMKRKAFEQNKKMQTAQAIINTAAAVTAALSSTPNFLANVALAAAAAAMGAAQIAVINSQSYSGGGSGGAASASAGASQLTVGERSKSVDIAKSRSAANELAYFRGEKGMGKSAATFTPAFMGAKYRAAGGPTTGYIVGEQGPELFIPSTPGRIAPNDEISSSQAPTNVNFSISALDADGVENVLTNQRGNIIGMIREAANSYGENFLEPVNVNAYSPVKSQGPMKY